MNFEYKDYELSNAITDIAAGPFGSNLKVSCFTTTGFPIIDGANLKEITVTDNITKFVPEDKARSLHRSIAKRRDVVVTISGNVGQVSYIPDNSQYAEYLCSQRQFRVTFDESKIYVPYLVYYLHSVEGQSKILAFANQTGVPALSQPLKNFRKIKIDLPSLAEQKKIAAILSALDEKIAINREINDNLLAQAQTLYKQFFPYGVQDDLPDGWRIGTVGEIIEIHDSKRIPLSGADRSKMEKKIYPYYGAASLMDLVDNYIFDGKYLLLGEDGTVVDDAGYPILQYVWGQFWVNNHAHILTGRLGYDVESLYMLFKQTPVKSIVTGAVQPKISQANLRSVQVVIPPEHNLREYNDLVEPLFSLFRANEEECKTFTALRDTLLPKLMSGEIDVSAVQL